MRHNTMLENEEINRDSIPFINRLLIMFSRKKKQIFEDISDSTLSGSTKPVIWAHIDSWVGPEILHPVLKLFAQECRYTILMTFSSLSANHEQLKDYDSIDYVFPLPADTESNAGLFISLAKPSAAIFAISAYSSNYLYQLKKRDIPTFLITQKITRPSLFLKRYDSLYRHPLKTFTHIFVFDNESKAFLEELGVGNATANKYPPIGNVWPKEKKHYHNAIIDRFVADERFIFIGGNIDTDKDLKLVSRLANANPALKCILAPHTISEEHLNRIKYELEGFTLLYSECDESTKFNKVQALVIDFIGALPHLYHYGSCAYIGGGFTPCLHNVIEATAHGLPTSFGPRIKHRILPKYLISRGISQIVKTPDDICQWEKNLKSNPALVHQINSDSIHFVEKSFESAYRIYTYINSCL